MERRLQEEVYNYFLGKTDRTDAEQALFRQLEFEMGYFQVTATHRDDLTREGYDISKISDEDMVDLASHIQDGIMESYWAALMEYARANDFPKFSCPECGQSNLSMTGEKAICWECDHKWTIE